MPMHTLKCMQEIHTIMDDNVTEKFEKEIDPIIEITIELFMGMEFLKHEEVRECYKKDAKYIGFRIHDC